MPAPLDYPSGHRQKIIPAGNRIASAGRSSPLRLPAIPGRPEPAITRSPAWDAVFHSNAGTPILPARTAAHITPSDNKNPPGLLPLSTNLPPAVPSGIGRDGSSLYNYPLRLTDRFYQIQRTEAGHFSG